jgi:hypothetical protein
VGTSIHPPWRRRSALNVSEETVKPHVSAIFTKLGVADRTQTALHTAMFRVHQVVEVPHSIRQARPLWHWLLK